MSEHVIPAACALRDSLLGTDQPVPVSRDYDMPNGQTMLSIDPDHLVKPGFGLRGVTGMTWFPGHDSTVRPPLQFLLKVVDSVALSAPQRQLTLYPDDSLTLNLGTMSTYPQRFPGVPGISQNMSAVLTSEQFSSLARAHVVHGTVGALAFDISPVQQRALRSLYVTAICGAVPEP
jgi:hypothetical protein